MEQHDPNILRRQLVARRPADADMTFGYGRAEIVAALINYTILIVVGVYAYVPIPGMAILLVLELMLTITPPFCAFILGMTACMPYITPKILSSMI